MKTRLILRKDIPELGVVGDVIEATAGYARNYLIPRGLAYAYSEDAVRRIEKARKESEAKRAALQADMEARAKRLGEVTLTFEENASEEGGLFGAVNRKRIADALAEKGFEVPENHVRLPEPIRQTGEYAVPIHVHADLATEIKVWVVAVQTETSEVPEVLDEETA